MKKTIQVSTVQKNAEVEVIFVNSCLISKAIRAQIALDAALEDTRTPTQATDENGEAIYDNGKPVQAKDDNGNLLWDYSYKGIREPSHLAALHEVVKSFIDELTTAFEQ